MENKNKNWDQIKQEYKEHTMSEEQVLAMKEKIKQAKKENRRKQTSHLRRKITGAAAAIVVLLTVLPNTSQSVAYAMSRVPLLSQWVKVVTFRDYQYSDDRNSANIQVPEITLDTEATKQPDPAVSEQTKKTTDEINTEIQAITDQLIAEFEESKKNEEGYQNMTVESEILATTDQYFTLKLTCYQAAGSGAEWDYYYTIDLDTGKRISLPDLFRADSDYIDVISDNIKEQMKSHMAADENVRYWLDSDMPEWDFKSITDDTSFYLNENGEVVICFNEGDVAPMSMGCVTFVIPNDVLADIRR